MAPESSTLALCSMGCGVGINLWKNGLRMWYDIPWCRASHIFGAISVILVHFSSHSYLNSLITELAQSLPWVVFLSCKNPTLLFFSLCSWLMQTLRSSLSVNYAASQKSLHVDVLKHYIVIGYSKSQMTLIVGHRCSSGIFWNLCNIFSVNSE